MLFLNMCMATCLPMHIRSWSDRRRALIPCTKTGCRTAKTGRPSRAGWGLPHHAAWSMMRLVSLGLMIAFLVTALHVVVDHGVSGEGHVVFFPHACPPHLGDHDQAADVHHQKDDEGEPAGEHHAGHHHADTHSHFMWSTPLGAKITWRLAASLLEACSPGAQPPGPGPSSLPVITCESPPRRVPLYLRCRVLLI